MVIAKNDPRRMERISGIKELDSAIAIRITLRRLEEGGYSRLEVQSFRKRWIFGLVTYAGMTEEGVPIWHVTPKGHYCGSLLHNLTPPNLLS